MDCSGRGNVCDYGNTGSFAFGNLAPGLSFTSASGTFLSGNVPEPASWAMLLAGFGLTGAALRGRRNKSGAMARRRRMQAVTA